MALKQVLILVSVLVAAASAKPADDRNSTAIPCLDAAQCKDNKTSVFATHNNQSYCCLGGNAIVVSASGQGYQITKSFYFSVNDNNNSTDDTERVKRDAKDEGKANQTFRCECKPVDESGSNLGLSVTSISDMVKGASRAFKKIFNDIFEDED